MFINKTARAGTKLLKDRATILVGGNMSGDKLKPFMLHKFKNPRLEMETVSLSPRVPKENL